MAKTCTCKNLKVFLNLLAVDKQIIGSSQIIATNLYSVYFHGGGAIVDYYFSIICYFGFYFLCYLLRSVWCCSGRPHGPCGTHGWLLSPAPHLLLHPHPLNLPRGWALLKSRVTADIEATTAPSHIATPHPALCYWAPLRDLRREPTSGSLHGRGRPLEQLPPLPFHPPSYL